MWKNLPAHLQDAFLTAVFGMVGTLEPSDLFQMAVDFKHDKSTGVWVNTRTPKWDLNAMTHTETRDSKTMRMIGSRFEKYVNSSAADRADETKLAAQVLFGAPLVRGNSLSDLIQEAQAQAQADEKDDE